MHTITSEEGYAKFINDNPNAIVKFSSESCPACAAVKDQYHELSDNSKYQSVTFAELEVANLQQLAAQNNIRGVPTFLYYQNGTEIEPKNGTGSPRRQVGASRMNFDAVTSENLDVAFGNGEAAKSMGAPREMAKQEPMHDGHEEEMGGGLLCTIKKLITSIFEAIGNLISSIVRAVKTLFGG